MADVCQCRDEKWRPVVGLEHLYLASSCGRIWALARVSMNAVGHIVHRKPRMMSPSRQATGHRTLTLTTDDGRKIAAKVHRLVALAFIGPPPEGKPDCCHYDGDPNNNHVGNLRWDTAKANSADSLRHGTHSQASKQVCPRGHALVEPNLIAGLFRRTGKRQCLSCSRTWNQERAAIREGRPVIGTFQERADRQYCDMMLGKAPRKPQNSKKFDAEHVRAIKIALAAGETQEAIAARFDTTQTTVSDIKRGRSWASVTV